MVRVRFGRSERGFVSVRVSGHAGFAGAGKDIVCAGVTSAVMLTANGLTEILGERAEVRLAPDEVSLTLPENPLDGSVSFLQALHLHLTLLMQQYPQNITITEV